MSKRYEESAGAAQEQQLSGKQPPLETQPSAEKQSGRSTAPARVAAGLTSLRVTLQQARKETGMRRALQVLGAANQKSGFDCPGCAWPDPEHRSVTEFCENGAKAMLDEATTKRVGAEFFKEHSIEQLLLKSERWLNAQGRLTVPLVRRPGASHYEETSYEAAIELIADELSQLGHADEAAFYTSGRTSNEAAFLYQLLVRSFGTNNLPDCSNLCHESSGVALKESIGIGKGTVRLSDFTQADAVFVIGQNPGSNHPRMLSALREAKLAGATVISVNPLVETGLVRFAHPQQPLDILSGGVPISDHFVRVAVNGDQALFRALSKALLEREAQGEQVIDRAFIATFCTGFEEFAAQVAKDSWPVLEASSGIPRKQIEDLVQLVTQAKNIICCWAMGLTQHKNAVATINEVTNFLLLRGNIGRPGAGVCPVRGHSNVQGDRSVGIVPLLPPEFSRRLASHFQFMLPSSAGLDTVGTIQAMNEGGVRAFISLGGNFLSASPDTDLVARGLSSCSLTVQISTKLNRSHLVTGKTAVILPCLGRSEIDAIDGAPQFVSVENSMGIVHASQGSLAPAHSELKSEAEIVGMLGDCLSKRGRSSARLEWRKISRDYDAIRNTIAQVIPGFENYNERLRQSGGFELENGPRERRFTTPSGKAQFVTTALDSISARPGELLLMTVRSHDQFNTTVYSNEDRYRGVSGTRKVLLMNPHDLKDRGLQPGDALTITSYFNEETRNLSGFTAMSYDVPAGAAVAYFPEANPLIFLNSHADRSRTPTSKSIRITVSAQTSERRLF